MIIVSLSKTPALSVLLVDLKHLVDTGATTEGEYAINYTETRNAYEAKTPT